MAAASSGALAANENLGCERGGDGRCLPGASAPDRHDELEREFEFSNHLAACTTVHREVNEKLAQQPKLAGSIERPRDQRICSAATANRIDANNFCSDKRACNKMGSIQHLVAAFRLPRTVFPQTQPLHHEFDEPFHELILREVFGKRPCAQGDQGRKKGHDIGKETALRLEGRLGT